MNRKKLQDSTIVALKKTPQKDHWNLKRLKSESYHRNAVISLSSEDDTLFQILIRVIEHGQPLVDHQPEFTRAVDHVQ